MALAPQILRAQVMHKRLLPRVNSFTYGLYYLSIPLSKLADLADGRRFGLERLGLMGFYSRDHGARDGSDLQAWVRNILHANNVQVADGEVVLVCMPRVLGYVFNPVSFWLCYDQAGELRAVLCEVNNTFGERHSYLCAHADRRPIYPDDILEAEKLFHVSPFLPRTGEYRFRFVVQPGKFAAFIDYVNGEGQLQLLTSMVAKAQPYTRANRQRAFWGTPLVTFKAVALIHWQALKLLAKGIRYIPKPLQLLAKITTTRGITKT